MKILFLKKYFSHEVDWIVFSLATIGCYFKRSTTAINFTYKILPTASVLVPPLWILFSIVWNECFFMICFVVIAVYFLLFCVLFLVFGYDKQYVGPVILCI